MKFCRLVADKGKCHADKIKVKIMSERIFRPILALTNHKVIQYLKVPDPTLSLKPGAVLSQL